MSNPIFKDRIVCRVCGADIDEKNQDNMSYRGAPICEDCADGGEPSEPEQVCFGCEKCIDCYGSGSRSEY